MRFRWTTSTCRLICRPALSRTVALAAASSRPASTIPVTAGCCSCCCCWPRHIAFSLGSTQPSCTTPGEAPARREGPTCKRRQKITARKSRLARPSLTIPRFVKSIHSHMLTHPSLVLCAAAEMSGRPNDQKSPSSSNRVAGRGGPVQENHAYADCTMCWRMIIAPCFFSFSLPSLLR